jgi:hypothetical protein
MIFDAAASSVENICLSMMNPSSKASVAVLLMKLTFRRLPHD